jgi:hypothetical protein
MHDAIIAPSSLGRAPAPPPPHADAEAGDPEGASFVLPIPARAQSPESPPSGWCGETAIQEGLLHLGVWGPQRLIHRAGHPAHPDLYSPEMPVALSELGVRFSMYSGARGFEPFARWARAAIVEGDPVIAGVKILPTEHPEWGLDHFVLVVGHGPKGLLVNTTWGHRAWVGDTTTPGLSLRGAFYGIRLRGVALPAGARAARLAVREERADDVTLEVACDGSAGARQRIERRSGTAVPPAWTKDVEAEGGRVSEVVTVPANVTSRFACVVR